MSTYLSYCRCSPIQDSSVTVCYFVFGRWKTYRSWRTSKLVAVRGEGWVFLCLELHCDKVNCTYGEKTLDQIWCRISDSLLGYRLKIPPAKNGAVHYVFMKVVQPFRHCYKRHCNWLLAIAYSPLFYNFKYFLEATPE